MKIISILLEKEEKAMTGTNCSNCKFTANNEIKEVEDGDLDKQGGGKLQTEEEIKRAKEADLITMPGIGKPDKMIMCAHPKVRVFVTPRQCCAFWDAEGTFREYGKQEIGK